jgi:hypothetical protein
MPRGAPFIYGQIGSFFLPFTETKIASEGLNRRDRRKRVEGEGEGAGGGGLISSVIDIRDKAGKLSLSMSAPDWNNYHY